MNPHGRAAYDFLLDMVGPRADPYEGADLGTSQRIVAAVLGLTGVLVLLFLPLEPVDEQIGSAGWVVASAIVVAAFAGALLVARRSPSFLDLLVIGVSRHRSDCRPQLARGRWVLGL